MIDALVAGRIYGTPGERTSKAGTRFATAKIRVSMRGDETAWVNVVAFSTSAVDALLALGDGDSIAISGELKVGTYTDKAGVTKPSIDLVAHVVLTPYHVARKRKAARSSSADPASADGGANRDFDDELPL